MGLRPKRSPSLPQTGIMIMPVMKCALTASPDQKLRFSVTPSWDKNRGKNGITCVQLADTRNVASHSTYKLRR